MVGSASDGTTPLCEFRVWSLLECSLGKAGKAGKAGSQAPFLVLRESIVLVSSLGKEMSVPGGWFAVSLLGPSQLRASVYLSVAMPCVDPDLSQHLGTTLLRFQAMELALYGHSKVVFDFLKNGGKICVT